MTDESKKEEQVQVPETTKPATIAEVISKDLSATKDLSSIEGFEALLYGAMSKFFVSIGKAGIHTTCRTECIRRGFQDLSSLKRDILRKYFTDEQIGHIGFALYGIMRQTEESVAAMVKEFGVPVAKIDAKLREVLEDPATPEETKKLILEKLREEDMSDGETGSCDKPPKSVSWH